MRFLIVASYAESLINFRIELINSLIKNGVDVHVACPFPSEDNVFFGEMEALGVTLHAVSLNRAGLNIFHDALTFFSLASLMFSVRPDAVLGYTVKPVVYGMLAAWLADVPRRYALITGLGYSFTGGAGWLRKLIRFLVQYLYTLALNKAHKVFFQNPDDERLFRELKLLHENIPSVILNGSGVDLEKFSFCSVPKKGVNFLLVARLLGDKGVREFARAAKEIKDKYPLVQFSLAGWIDDNPDAIKLIELNRWVESGALKYLGRLSDVRSAISECTVFVLPSYREGTPRTVLEAMSIGRAIITTDAPGCRETVVDGYNGFLVPVKSVQSLIEAMEHFIKLPALAEEMGVHSREIAEIKYDVHKVNDVMLKEMLGA